MITELFYPKELKEVIADLRAKGDLNEQALKSSFWDFRVLMTIMMFYIIIFMILIYNVNFNGDDIFLIIFILIFMMLIMPYSASRIWDVYMQPYIHGRLSSGKIQKIKRPAHAWRDAFEIIVRENKTNKMMTVYINPHKTFKFFKYLPKVGEDISFFVSIYDPEIAVPNIKEFMEIMCLKKSLLSKAQSVIPHQHP